MKQSFYKYTLSTAFMSSTIKRFSLLNRSQPDMVQFSQALP
jgi:hypothetical protein